MPPKSLHSFFRRFSPRVVPTSRLETQLLSRLLDGIVIILVTLLIIVVVTSIGDAGYTIQPLELLTYGVCILLWLVVYGINHCGYIHTAGLLLVASFTVLNVMLVVITADASAVYLVYYFIVPVLISNLFLSFRITASIYVFHLLLMLALPVFAPDIRFQDLPVIFYMMICGIMLFNRLYRNLIETTGKNTEQRYQALFESIYDPVIVYENGIYRAINPAFETMFNLPRADLIDQPMVNGTIPVTEPADALMKLTDGTSEITARRGQTTFPVEVHVRTYRQDQRRLQVATLRDLTERKLASQQSEALALESERVRLMRRFINDVSHDLRTPLTILMTGLYMVKIASSPEQQQKRIETMETHIESISKMLDNMLTIARLEKAGSDSFDFQEDDLNQAVLDCYHEQQLIAENKNLQFRFVPDAALPPIMMDHKELCRALRQLFLNAIKYTPVNGVIETRTRQVDNCAIFEIQDSGIGIPPEKLTGIFELFYRVDEARGIDTGGMGMGLAICQRIIEAHHGKIEVESTPGIGSTFRVILPLSQAMSSTAVSDHS